MVNEKRLLDTFLEYIKIDSESKNEKAMGEKLVADLKALGLEVIRPEKALAPTASTCMRIFREPCRATPRSCAPTWIR